MSLDELAILTVIIFWGALFLLAICIVLSLFEKIANYLGKRLGRRRSR